MPSGILPKSLTKPNHCKQLVLGVEKVVQSDRRSDSKNTPYTIPIFTTQLPLPQKFQHIAVNFFSLYVIGIIVHIIV
jgi:hypothetical protein